MPIITSSPIGNLKADLSSIASGSQVRADTTTHRIHIFESSGSFTVSRGSLTSVDILVVAGGAGGGGRWSGGGGGGGVVWVTGTTFIVGTYTVVVGLGGAGVRGTGLRGGTGGNSTFTQTSGGSTVTLLAKGGGGGTSYNSALATAGGSSGGTYGHSTAPVSETATQPGTSQTHASGTATVEPNCFGLNWVKKYQDVSAEI